MLYDCCENPGLIDDRHILCKNCGTVYGNRVTNEFVDFYENRYIIRKRTICHRNEFLRGLGTVNSHITFGGVNALIK